MEEKLNNYKIKKNYPIEVKVKIVREAIEKSNIKKTARKYHLCPKSIRDWKKKLDKWENLLSKEKEIHNSDLFKYDENQLIDWILSNKTDKCITNAKIYTYLSENMVDFQDIESEVIKEWVYNILTKNFDKVQKFLSPSLYKICQNKYQVNEEMQNYETEFEINEIFSNNEGSKKKRKLQCNKDNENENFKYQNGIFILAQQDVCLALNNEFFTKPISNANENNNVKFNELNIDEMKLKLFNLFQENL